MFGPFQSVNGSHLRTYKISHRNDNICHLTDSICHLNEGLAVNDDVTLMAVAKCAVQTIVLYTLPSGHELTTFGGRGSGIRIFTDPYGLCFTKDGSLLVADGRMRRVFNLTVTGKLKRTIGVGSLEACPDSVTCNSDVIVVSQASGDEERWVDEYCIAVFDYRSGDLIRKFGDFKCTYGTQVPSLRGICLTSDGGQVLAVDYDNNCICRYSIEGQLMQVFGGDGQLIDPHDVCVVPSGGIVVAGHRTQDVIVFSRDGTEVVKRFGCEGTADGQFCDPWRVCCGSGKLFVLDYGSPRVQVFE